MNRIKDLRKKHNLTGEQLGKILNVQKAAISKYERGDVQPSPDVLIKLSEIFNVSIDYLLGRDEPKLQVYDEETLEIMDELRSRPELKMLFKSSTNATREDIEAVANMFDKMNKRND